MTVDVFLSMLQGCDQSLLVFKAVSQQDVMDEPRAECLFN